jgi:hypothetical protein
MMQPILKILVHTTPARAHLRLVRLRSYKSVVVSPVDFASDVIESKSSWEFGIIGESYGSKLDGCQSCSVGLEGAFMGVGDMRVSMSWTCRLSISKINTAYYVCFKSLKYLPSMMGRSSGNDDHDDVASP